MEQENTLLWSLLNARPTRKTDTPLGAINRQRRKEEQEGKKN